MIIDADSVARFAGLLADRTRVVMCLALLDGRAWTSGELAREAGVAASTASGHLTHLVDAGLLVQQRQGRHRYVRLRDQEAARLVETLAGAAGAVAPPRRSLGGARAHRALLVARTCYDHLAGRLGTAVYAALRDKGLLSEDDGLALTSAGRGFLADLGCVLPEPGRSRRPLVRSCLDWTERRPHLAGAAGAALHRALLAHRWTVPGARPRAIAVTPSGRRALGELLGLDTDALAAETDTGP